MQSISHATLAGRPRKKPFGTEKTVSISGSSSTQTAKPQQQKHPSFLFILAFCLTSWYIFLGTGGRNIYSFFLLLVHLSHSVTLFQQSNFTSFAQHVLTLWKSNEKENKIPNTQANNICQF